MSRIKYFLDTDGNGAPIQAAHSFGISDNTGTPNTSPIAVVTGTASALVIPDNAKEIYLFPLENMYYAPDASASADHGFLIPADTLTVLPVGPGETHSVIASVSGNLFFGFGLLAGRGNQ